MWLEIVTTYEYLETILTDEIRIDYLCMDR